MKARFLVVAVLLGSIFLAVMSYLQRLSGTHKSETIARIPESDTNRINKLLAEGWTKFTNHNNTVFLMKPLDRPWESK